jgi:hypothetical protein
MSVLNRRTHATATGDRRISAKVRKALHLVAWQGLTQREAAQEAGLHPVSLSRALAHGNVRTYLDEQKALVLQEIERLKTRAKLVALQEGIKMMGPDAPANVRARMVELFSAEPRAAGNVAVQVNVDRGGYEYVRPGSQVVDVIPQDAACHDDDA